MRTSNAIVNTRIGAVIVTFNRLPYLQQLLPALQTQTVPVNEVIVVNNSSTDGTKEWLETQTLFSIIQQGNTGGAGGFSTGIKSALEKGVEWIWVMDDDVLPQKDCLEKLLSYSFLSECLLPIHLNCEGKILDEERWFNPADCSIQSFFNSSYKQGKKYWFTNIGSFEGMLLSADIIKKIGYPDQRFFLMHDDMVYGFLAHQHTNLAVIADAVMQKQAIPTNEERLYRGLYYQFRNLWLVQEYADKFLPALKFYRRRRIRLQFWYEAYKIIRLKEYPNKKKALQTLWSAYKAYKKKTKGKSFA